VFIEDTKTPETRRLPYEYIDFDTRRRVVDEIGIRDDYAHILHNQIYVYIERKLIDILSKYLQSRLRATAVREARERMYRHDIRLLNSSVLVRFTGQMQPWETAVQILPSAAASQGPAVDKRA